MTWSCFIPPEEGEVRGDRYMRVSIAIECGGLAKNETEGKVEQ